MATAARGEAGPAGALLRLARRAGARLLGPRMLNQLVRDEVVLRLVRELDASIVLDLGSGSVSVARWLGPSWQVTAVDTSFEDYGAAHGPASDGAIRVLADGRDLPFAADAFEVSVAIDVVEHLPASERSRLLAELGRVTSRRTIVGCPTGAPALAADRRLADAYRRRSTTPPAWLDEHLAHGFPEPEHLVAGLAPHGATRLLGHEALRAHEAVARLEATRVGARASRALARLLAPAARGDGRRARAASRVAWMIRGGDRTPAYRTIAVVDIDAGPSRKPSA